MPLRLAHRASRGRGFTLVELLVVIGIIALWISMLLPALNRAREQAKQVQCLSNIRQLGMAVLLYCNEHKDLMPAGAEGPPQIKWDWVYWDPTAAPFDYDQLADRHTRRHQNELDNDGTRGNVCFFDGHATQVSRLDARNQEFWDPTR